MRRLAIRRPACVLSTLFIIFTYVILELSGGVNLYEEHEDGEKIYVTAVITNMQKKEFSDCIHIRIIEDSGTDRKEDEWTAGKTAQERIENDRTKRRNDECYIVYLESQKTEDFKIGQQVYVCGNYKSFELPQNDGQFNSREYYRIRGYKGSIKKGKVLKASTEYGKLKDFLYRVKEKTKSVFKNNMSETGAATLSAMVLGDKTELDPEIKELYQSVGISHILSLSGLHIATVGMAVFMLLMKTGLGTMKSSVLATALIIIYGIMTGFSTSTFRALIMFILSVIARNIGRTYDLLSAVNVSATLILFENPYLIYDSGFGMSFLAVLGIGLIYPVLNDITELPERSGGIILSENNQRTGQIIRKIYLSDFAIRIRQSICISLSATLATFPVVINSFYKISRYSILINLLVVPLMSVILAIGIIAGITGNIFCGIPVLDGGVHILLTGAEIILSFYTGLSEKVSGMSLNSWVVGKGEKWQSVVYITILFATCLLFEIIKSQNYYRLKTVLLIVTAVVTISIRIYPDFDISVLSVGQGACNVIYGKSVPTIMIDGGSSDIKDVWKYRIKPFLLSNGIDEIDYMFITHPDSDHICGIEEMLDEKIKDIKVRHIFMSVYDEAIVSSVKAYGTEFHLMYEGDSIKCDHLQIECISPENSNQTRNSIMGDEPISVTKADEDINDLSLVLKLIFSEPKADREDFSAIFTGDISSDVERSILNNEKGLNEISDVDLVTVAHHGSRYSSCEDFLKATNASLYTISAGINNSYGHPHSETIERLNGCVPDAMVLRTDECGQITVTVNDGKTYVRKGVF